MGLQMVHLLQKSLVRCMGRPLDTAVSFWRRVQRSYAGFCVALTDARYATGGGMEGLTQTCIAQMLP